MTRDEVLNMEAGEELDALVAEKVMGWHVREDRFGKDWVDAENNYQHRIGRYDDYEDSEDFHTINWHPSESMLWAWEVVEKLCDETGCDVVKVCKRDPELLRGEWSCNFGRGFEAFAETASLAICRAALLTVLDG